MLASMGGGDRTFRVVLVGIKNEDEVHIVSPDQITVVGVPGRFGHTVAFSHRGQQCRGDVADGRDVIAISQGLQDWQVNDLGHLAQPDKSYPYNLHRFFPFQ
jgi:hypothetical protein